MRLLWIRYKSKGKLKYGLFLTLADQDGNLIILNTKQIDSGDRKRIRASINTLNRLDPTTRINWIKQSCPISYKKAYRRLKSGDYTIVKEFRPQAIGVA